MQPLTADTFGPLIAYLLPGFFALWAAQPFVPTVAAWLGAAGEQPTVGGFLYATLASTAAGLVVSAVRWALVDTLHHRTGIPLPRWEFRRLPQALAAFESLVEGHYVYYQFYANTFVSLIIVYGLRLAGAGRWPGARLKEDLAFLLVAAVLYFGSRDALRKYYDRTAAFLSSHRRTKRATEAVRIDKTMSSSGA